MSEMNIDEQIENVRAEISILRNSVRREISRLDNELYTQSTEITKSKRDLNEHFEKINTEISTLRNSIHSEISRLNNEMCSYSEDSKIKTQYLLKELNILRSMAIKTSTDLQIQQMESESFKESLEAKNGFKNNSKNSSNYNTIIILMNIIVILVSVLVVYLNYPIQSTESRESTQSKNNMYRDVAY